MTRHVTKTQTPFGELELVHRTLGNAELLTKVSGRDPQVLINCFKEIFRLSEYPYISDTLKDLGPSNHYQISELKDEIKSLEEDIRSLESELEDALDRAENSPD